MRQKRRATESGSALIEFAFSATGLLMLGLGAVSFGFAVRNSEVVADAAFVGASYGANSTSNAVDTATMQQLAQSSDSTIQNLTATATYWCTCSPGGSVVSFSSACGSDQPMY